MGDLPATIYDVPTPCLLVDIDKVKRNCTRMINRYKDLDVELRPHMKTHKTIEGADLMTGGTRRKIVVSTLSEAEFFANAGFDDILYGYPITESKLQRCKKIYEKCTQFHLLLDNSVAIDALEKTAPGQTKRWTVFLEIDVGGNRTGVIWDSDEVIELARRASQAANIEFMGLYTHSDMSYGNKSKEGVRKQAAQDSDKMLQVYKRVQEAGITVKTFGVGDTPCCSVFEPTMAKLTEVHPGNYVFYDTMQNTIGSCDRDDIAIRVATRVITHKPDLNQIYVDSGYLALSHDGFYKDLPNGIASFQDHPELRLVNMSQEIGYLSSRNGKIDCHSFPIDSMLFIYPYHSCATAANHDIYYVHSGEKVIGVWKPVKGW